jgi:hypothetical protein
LILLGILSQGSDGDCGDWTGSAVGRRKAGVAKACWSTVEERLVTGVVNLDREDEVDFVGVVNVGDLEISYA